MQRIVTSALLVLLFTGCGQKPAATPAPTVAAKPDVLPEPYAPLLPPVTPSVDDQYDSAFGQAVALLGDGKLGEALTALEKARAAKDTEVVRGEIERLRIRLDLRSAAEKAANDIQVVLKQGNAAEASRLAAQALAHFGTGEWADRFTSLKLQADALTVSTDQAARSAQLQREADTALAATNYRAAIVSLEQFVSLKPDAEARRRLADLREKVARYDDLRAKGALLRRDPARVEEALATYRQAAGVWDTVEVRQDIESCLLAAQNRRERVGIADFEVLGDVGLPNAGRVVADELVPVMRGKFDVVERQQLAALVGEMRMRPDEILSSDRGRGELAQLGSVRFLVVGSLTPLPAGITVNARLVEVGSGLVVQTGKVVARHPAEIARLVPQLGLMLQMSDQERWAYENSLSAASPPPIVTTAIQPRPAVPPPPMVTFAPRLPDAGGIVVDDFDRLPPSTGTTIAFTIAKDHKAKARLTQLAVSLGDSLFAAGKVREAQAQFQLALSLAPGQSAIQKRLDECGRHDPLPPPRRPRLVVLDFVTAGVSPGLGAWAAETLSPYFTPNYDVVDSGTVYWYMGRLGLSLRDVVLDPSARAYLGRALNVRYFVAGRIQPKSGGLRVEAYEFDAPTGDRLDVAALVARTPAELKLRLPELAQWMMTDPQVRLARQRRAAEWERLIAEAESHCSHRRYREASQIYVGLLDQAPNDVRVRSLYEQTERLAKRDEWERSREAEWRVAAQRQQTDRQRAEQLTRLAQEARRAAERTAASADADRLRQRRQAADKLVSQARAARDAQRYAEARQFYESALAMDRAADVERELQAVKARLDEQQKLRADQAKAERDEQLRAQAAKVKRDRDQYDRLQAKAAAEKSAATPPALPASPPSQPKELPKAGPQGPPAEYTKQMRAGSAAERAGKFAEAAQAYQAALKAIVNDPAAAKRAEYCRDMDAGTKALGAKKFADAVKAFEAALKVAPNEPAALRGLKQARAGK